MLQKPFTKPPRLVEALNKYIVPAIAELIRKKREQQEKNQEKVVNE